MAVERDGVGWVGGLVVVEEEGDKTKDKEEEDVQEEQKVGV